MMFYALVKLLSGRLPKESESYAFCMIVAMIEFGCEALVGMMLFLPSQG